MKRRIVIALCLAIFLCLALVSCKDKDNEKPDDVITDGGSYSELEFTASGEYDNGDRWFIGEVIEVNDGSILVKPHKNTVEIKSADKISVSTNVKEGELPYDLKEGAIVCVVYNGAIAESYPAQINSTTAIYISDGAYRGYQYTDEENFTMSASFLITDGGSYTMTFGALSSHIGIGTYKIEDGYLYLTEGDSGDTYVFSLSEDGSKAIFKKDMSTGRSWFSSFTDGSEFNYVKS